jgi:hypothetical protein
MMVLFHADCSNTRYNWFLYRFANAWTNDLPEFSPDSKPTSGVVNLKGLQYEDPPYWVRLRQSNQQNAYVTPGPLGMNLRAMSMIALHASRQENESDADRRHVCFALAQLRCAAPSTPLVACAGSCTSHDTWCFESISIKIYTIATCSSGARLLVAVACRRSALTLQQLMQCSELLIQVIADCPFLNVQPRFSNVSLPNMVKSIIRSPMTSAFWTEQRQDPNIDFTTIRSRLVLLCWT